MNVLVQIMATGLVLFIGAAGLFVLVGWLWRILQDRMIRGEQ